MDKYLWLINHWEEITLAATGVVSVASIIAKLTPTEVDNKLVALILKIVDVLALNNKPTELKK